MTTQPVTNPRTPLTGVDLSKPTTRIPPRTSDDPQPINPYKDEKVQKGLRQEKPLVCRRVIAGWNKSTGAQLQLDDGSDERRFVVIKPGMPLYEMLVQRDPRIAHLLDIFTQHTRPVPQRQLYPRFTVEVKRGSDGHSTILASEPNRQDLPMSTEETGMKAFQDAHDMLDDTRKARGMGRAEFDQIVRKHQPTADWFGAQAEIIMRTPIVKRQPQPVASEPQPMPELGVKETLKATKRLMQELGAVHPDGTPYQKPAEPTASAEPVKPAHWADDAAQRGKFWARVNGEGFNKYSLTRLMSKDEREDIVHEQIGPLHETALSPDTAADAVIMYLNITFGKGNQQAVKPIENTPEFYDNLQKERGSTQAAPEQSAPASAPAKVETASAALPDAKSAPSTPASTFDQKSGCVTTEIAVNGHRLKVTAFQGQSAEQIRDNVFALINGLRMVARDETVREYAVIGEGRDTVSVMKTDGEFLPDPVLRRPMPASTPMQNSTTGGSSAPANGTVVCNLIRVGKSYTGNKPQLQFECDGLEKPLMFTRDNLISILKDAKVKGQPFSADMLTDGRKFIGEWVVDFDTTEKDGKHYKNVVAVRNAA